MNDRWLANADPVRTTEPAMHTFNPSNAYVALLLDETVGGVLAL